MIARLVAVAAGIWLMFSPAVFEAGNPAASNGRIFGPIGAAFAFVAVWEVVRPLRWVTFPVGLWLIVAPFILGFDQSSAVISSIVTGLIMAGTAPLGANTNQVYGGGWKTLLPGKFRSGL